MTFSGYYTTLSPGPLQSGVTERECHLNDSMLQQGIAEQGREVLASTLITLFIYMVCLLVPDNTEKLQKHFIFFQGSVDHLTVIEK